MSIVFDYDKDLWDYLERLTNDEGKIVTDQEELEMFLLPRQTAGFQPSQEVITIMSSLVTPFAISLFANYVYDLMQIHKAKVESINGKKTVSKNANEIKHIIMERFSTVKQKDIEIRK